MEHSLEYVVEARERDVEAIAKEIIESETFDAARTGIRGKNCSRTRS